MVVDMPTQPNDDNYLASFPAESLMYYSHSTVGLDIGMNLAYQVRSSVLVG
jgi:hypothetical protein